MKVRIGVGLGPNSDPATFGETVDELEATGIDSLWLSEVVFGRSVEPVVGMANALGRTKKLKLGTGVAVLPGRQPVLVAKQLLSLAALAPARVLPAFGLRPARKEERQLFPVPPGQRAAVFDESLTLLRRLLTEDEVTFHGKFHDVAKVTTGPKPKKPLDIWLGGQAPAALERIGKKADGWLGSFLTPEQAKQGIATIKETANTAGREIEEDHFGLSLAVATNGDIPEAALEAAKQRNPQADPTHLIANGWQTARTLLERHIEAGLSKFVIRPATPGNYQDFLAGVRAELLPLQN